MGYGTMTAKQLRTAQTAYEKATEKVEWARELRADFVREALDEGWTHARIAEATGLSRGRIGQIASA